MNFDNWGDWYLNLNVVGRLRGLSTSILNVANIQGAYLPWILSCGDQGASLPRSWQKVDQRTKLLQPLGDYCGRLLISNGCGGVDASVGCGPYMKNNNNNNNNTNNNKLKLW